MRLACKDIGTSADFLEALAIDLETGFAAEDHCQDFTVPVFRPL